MRENVSEIKKLIIPTENRSEHCKVYAEPSLKKAVERFQDQRGLESFSDAGRELWIIALTALINEK